MKLQWINIFCGILQLPYQCLANIQIFEYIRIFIDEYIHSPKYSWILSKRCIHTFIRYFFLLLNIFWHSFGLLDSNKYIRVYSLHKIKLVIQQIWFIFYKIYHVISLKSVNIWYSNLFAHSFISILNEQINLDIHSWNFLRTEYIWIFVCV